MRLKEFFEEYSRPGFTVMFVFLAFGYMQSYLTIVNFPLFVIFGFVSGVFLEYLAKLLGKTKFFKKIGQLMEKQIHFGKKI